MNFLNSLFNRKKRHYKVDLRKRFDLIGRVGQGSMSKVFRAQDLLTGRMVALKVLDKIRTKRFEARFVGLNKPLEGEIASSLQHPNIVRTIEHGMTSDGEQYLVMEFIEGLSMSYLIEVQNENMRKNRLKFVLQFGDALNYIHKQNWIHRDVCPRNALLDSDYNVKLIDFGLTVPNTAPFRRPGNRTGTASYMAPELIKRQATDQRIDIFSYAVTCYEIYTGRLPWDRSEVSLEMALQHINAPPVDIRTLVPDIDEQVAAAIMKGLSHHPDDRYSRMSEMLLQFRNARTRLEGVRDEAYDYLDQEAATRAAAPVEAPLEEMAPLRVEDEYEDVSSQVIEAPFEKDNQPAPVRKPVEIPARSRPRKSSASHGAPAASTAKPVPSKKNPDDEVDLDAFFADADSPAADEDDDDDEYETV